MREDPHTAYHSQLAKGAQKRDAAVNLPGALQRRAAVELAPHSPHHRNRAVHASCAEPAAPHQTSCSRGFGLPQAYKTYPKPVAPHDDYSVLSQLSCQFMGREDITRPVKSAESVQDSARLLLLPDRTISTAEISLAVRSGMGTRSSLSCTDMHPCNHTSA